jgi:hypothetical protein
MKSEKTTVVPFDKDGKVHQRLFITDLANNERKELNQMKFVCRQLYEETSSLSPHSTHLVFPLRKDTKDAASLICGRFIGNTCADALVTTRRIDVFKRIPYYGRGYWKRVFDTRYEPAGHFCSNKAPRKSQRIPRVCRARESWLQC